MRAAFFSSSPFSVLSSQFGVLHSGRNYDFLRDFLIDWRDVIAMAIMKDADYSRVGAVDWAHDSPLSTAVRPDGAHLDEHAISVHRRADCGRGMKMSPESRAFCRSSSDVGSGRTKAKPSRCILRRPANGCFPV